MHSNGLITVKISVENPVITYCHLFCTSTQRQCIDKEVEMPNLFVETGPRSFPTVFNIFLHGFNTTPSHQKKYGIHSLTQLFYKSVLNIVETCFEHLFKYGFKHGFEHKFNIVKI